MGTEMAFCFLKEVHSHNTNDRTETLQPFYHLACIPSKKNISITFRYAHPHDCQRLFSLIHEKAVSPLTNGTETFIYNVQPTSSISAFMYWTSSSISALRTQQQQPHLYSISHLLPGSTQNFLDETVVGAATMKNHPSIICN